MKLDLKERDFLNEDEIEQIKLRKQIEKSNVGFEGHCWQQASRPGLGSNSRR
ncbi:hypothetical protein PR003_g17490 [Phytophthora rubi]|uniref:Uncharacterized protein n=1 Tax=Phytophthora rubi TaxID=129364 RepID=A0A6A3KPT0_9STRA|nr:hypothetical protein PR002_g17003 [Phytophthora rubi]KAE9007687.1 hypothetical protein PR001_g16896 [Phytophthora rubi]KAE9321375.1 hypothetical protein PR003_g17490 [Phytophthora rubi]